ncbi:MAG: YfhO family protein [Patescibacteria group bacterium]
MSFIAMLITRVKTERWAVIAVFLAPFIIFSQKIFRNIPLSYGDYLSQYYIWQSYLVNALKSFRLPLWNPHVFSGTPFLANPQAAAFYPLNWLKIPFASGGFLPFYVFQTFTVMEISLGAIFFYLLVKYYTKKIAPAFFSALVYCLSPVILVFFLDWVTILSVITWWPLTILWTEKFFENYKRRYLIYLIFTLSLAWLGCHPGQFFLSFAGLIIFWFIKSVKKRNLPVLAWLIVISFFTLALVAIQIIPAFEFMLRASRAEMIYAIAPSTPFTLSNLAGFFTPESYSHLPTAVGIIAMFFVVLSFFGAKKNKYIKTWILFLLISLLLYAFCAVFGLRLTNSPVLYNLIRYTERMLYYPVFSLALLAGFGLPIFFDLVINNRRKILIIFIFFSLAALTFISLGASVKSLYISLTALVLLAFLMFIFSRHEKWQRIIAGLIILVNLAFTGYFYAEIINPKKQQNIQDYLTAHRLAPAEPDPIPKNKFFKNSAMIYGRYATEGWDSLILSSYEKVSASQNIKNLPRFWLVSEVKKQPTQEAAAKILNEEIIDLKTYGLVTGEFAWENKKAATGNKIDIIAEKPEKIELAVSSNQPSILVVKDSDYPGWQASLDGQTVKIERINVYMRAIKMPAGNHKITMKYQPVSLRIGAAVSLITILLLIGYLIFLSKPKNLTQKKFP